MTLERFGFRPVATSSAVTLFGSDGHDPLGHTVEDSIAQPSKRRRFNRDWAEGRTWLKDDQENGVIFGE